MILLPPGQVRRVYLKCGCHKTTIDADDLDTFQRKCRDCKLWTRFTVRKSPSGLRVEVYVEFAPPEPQPPPRPACGDETGASGRLLAPVTKGRTRGGSAPTTAGKAPPRVRNGKGAA